MKLYLYFAARYTVVSMALLTAIVSIARGQISSATNAVTQMGATSGAAASNLPKSASVAVPTNYVLKANDEIQIRVFRNTELDGPRRISKDGTIDFPLLGIVNVAGKTPYEAAAHLAALLDKDYLVRPQVFVNVTSVAKRHFNILGEVTTPGMKEFPDDRELDILGAISMAGGFTKTASQVNIIVKRRVGTQEQLFKVDAARMVKEKGVASFFIQPNDIILVKERFL